MGRQARFEWADGPTYAWASHDGPKPPGGQRFAHRVSIGLSLALAATFAAMSFSDVLCPDHRAVVAVLAATATLLAGAAVVGGMRSWPSAPLLLVVSTSLGISMGLIDSIHAARRGAAVAIVFSALTVVAIGLAIYQVRLVIWERKVRALATAGPLVELSVNDPAPVPADTPSDARSGIDA